MPTMRRPSHTGNEPTSICFIFWATSDTRVSGFTTSTFCVITSLSCIITSRSRIRPAWRSARPRLGCPERSAALEPRAGVVGQLLGLVASLRGDFAYASARFLGRVHHAVSQFLALLAQLVPGFLARGRGHE